MGARNQFWKLSIPDMGEVEMYPTAVVVSSSQTGVEDQVGCVRIGVGSLLPILGHEYRVTLNTLREPKLEKVS